MFVGGKSRMKTTDWWVNDGGSVTERELFLRRRRNEWCGRVVKLFNLFDDSFYFFFNLFHGFWIGRWDRTCGFEWEMKIGENPEKKEGFLETRRRRRRSIWCCVWNWRGGLVVNKGISMAWIFLSCFQNPHRVPTTSQSNHHFPFFILYKVFFLILNVELFFFSCRQF